jgi:hypothetical protein
MDYGMAVSQKGFDVKTCDPRFYVYSSAFQTLKIFNTFTASTKIPSSGTHTITITHNLGYYAPYLVVYNGSTGSRGITQSFLFSDGRYDLNTQFTTSALNILVPSTFDFAESGSGNTVYFTVYIFLDDFRMVAEQSINAGSSLGTLGADYGIRISKQGFDVKNCANINCVLSSSFFNQIVNKKGTVTGASATVPHSLGYPPNFLFYVNPSGNSYITFEGLNASIDSTTLYTDLFTGDTGYYIILKDKLA